MQNHGDDLGPVERHLLAHGWCADCQSILMPGPRGGAAQNFYCSERTSCRAGYNLTFHGGQLVFAQRIGTVTDDTYAMYAKK